MAAKITHGYCFPSLGAVLATCSHQSRKAYYDAYYRGALKDLAPVCDLVEIPYIGCWWYGLVARVGPFAQDNCRCWVRVTPESTVSPRSLVKTVIPIAALPPTAQHSSLSTRCNIASMYSVSHLVVGSIYRAFVCSSVWLLFESEVQWTEGRCIAG